MNDAVLVTGATGKQGGATIRALLAAGVPAVALVRDLVSSSALALAAKGVRLVRGDLDEPETLQAAMRDVRRLFSVQLSGAGDNELRQARNLASAAKTANVRQIVHTSVSGVAGPVGDGPWTTFMEGYFASKAGAEEALRAVGAQHTTILRPATFMENFLRPALYFAGGTSSQLQVAYDLDVPQSFIAVDDIGDAAAAAFVDPDRFSSVELELAGDIRTFREAAEILSAAWGEKITPPPTRGLGRENGLPEPYVLSQEFMSKHPQPARPEFASALGLIPTTLDAWARTHR